MNIAHQINKINTLSAPTPKEITIAECVTKTASCLGGHADALSAAVWVEKLSKFSADQIKESFNDWLDKERKFPVPADILEFIKIRAGEGVLLKWNQAYQAARLAGSSNSKYVIFDDAATHFAIEVMGGWSHLRDRVNKPSDFSFAQRDFEKAHREYRIGLPYRSGFGQFDGSNVVLIGNLFRAKKVFEDSRQRPNFDEISGLNMLHFDWGTPNGLELPLTLLPEHFYVFPSKESIDDAPWINKRN